MMAYPERLAFQRAAEIIRGQGFTPISPCSMDEQGSLHLCAAAALAAAGLELTDGHKGRSEFESALSVTRDFELVEAAFDKLGWDRSICTRILQRNNGFIDRERTSGVINMFSIGDQQQWR